MFREWFVFSSNGDIVNQGTNFEHDLDKITVPTHGSISFAFGSGQKFLSILGNEDLTLFTKNIPVTWNDP